MGSSGSAAAAYAVALGRGVETDRTVLRTLAERELIDLADSDVDFTFTSEVKVNSTSPSERSMSSRSAIVRNPVLPASTPRAAASA